MSAAKPAPLALSEIPSNLAQIVASGSTAAVGRLRNIIPLLPASNAPPLPAPFNNATIPDLGRSADIRHVEAETGGVEDHTVEGWAYGSANNAKHPYYGEGFVEFAVDVSAPTLFLPTAGSSGAYVYYSPTVQGTDGNPLEISFATYYTFAGGAGSAEILIYDWASSNGLPCGGAGQQNCIGFLGQGLPVNSTFFSNYVRNIGQPVAEFSVVVFRSGSTWYACLYTHSTSTYDVIASEAHSEVVYDQRYNNGTLGVTGGHAYAEYYVPPSTYCANVDPQNPLSGEPLTSNAQQYSDTLNEWIRVSGDANAYSDPEGGTFSCFRSPSPFFAFSFYGDGLSNWQAIPD